jgi:hypothetical protein
MTATGGTTATAGMTAAEARALRLAHDDAARRYGRMPKAKLAAAYRKALAERGQEILLGGPASKDELVAAILGLDYPIARLNEAIHVAWHDTAWPGCPHCAERAA